MFESGLAGTGEFQKFEEAGVDIISNTPEEICDLAIEVDERLRGQWQPHSEDEALQKHFWDIFYQNGSLREADNIPPPIGSKFLRQHRYLLD